MRGIRRFLPGQKNKGPAHPDGGKFFQEFKADLLGNSESQRASFTALDIETGDWMDHDGARFGVKSGEEALNPYTGLTLLAAFMGPDGRYIGITDENGDKVLIEKTLLALNKLRAEEKYLVGHNLLGFDIPWIVNRSLRAHDKEVPYWLRDLCSPRTRYRAFEDRVIDTLCLFDRSRHSTPGTAVSLGLLTRFWKKDLPGEGKSFGRLWRSNDPQTRAYLKTYNAWNLIDSILLAYFAGAIDATRETPIEQDPAGRPYGLEWRNTGDLDFRANPNGVVEVVKEPELEKSNIAFFSWLTGPLPGVALDGPLGSWETVKVTRSKTKEEWPFLTGRQHFAGVQIIGLVCASGSGNVELVWEPGDEVLAICKGLELVSARRVDSRCFCESKSHFRALVTMRLSLYNGVMEAWVNQFGVTEWLHDLSEVMEREENRRMEDPGVYAVWRGWTSSYFDFSIPLWCGEDGYQERVMRIAKVLQAFVSDSPSLVRLPPSPKRAVPALV